MSSPMTDLYDLTTHCYYRLLDQIKSNFLNFTNYCFQRYFFFGYLPKHFCEFNAVRQEQSLFFHSPSYFFLSLSFSVPFCLSMSSSVFFCYFPFFLCPFLSFSVHFFSVFIAQSLCLFKSKTKTLPICKIIE